VNDLFTPKDAHPVAHSPTVPSYRPTIAHSPPLVQSAITTGPSTQAKITAARVRERAQKVPAIFGAISLETLGHTTDEFMHMMPNSAPRTASEWGEPASREWHTRIM